MREREGGGSAIERSSDFSGRQVNHGSTGQWPRIWHVPSLSGEDSTVDRCLIYVNEQHIQIIECAQGTEDHHSMQVHEDDALSSQPTFYLVMCKAM